MREAEEALAHDFPQKAEAFETYAKSVFDYLRMRWHSAADVNSPWTDEVFAVKHAFQNKLFGPKEEEAWEGWNHYFLQQVVAAAKANPGKRIVVLVGVEHGYWMREHLRNFPEVDLLDTAGLLH